MQSISHTYISLYATSDNETHFRMVQARLDRVEDFAIQGSRSISAARF